VLDLFAGLGGWSQPFIDNGHEVFRVDFDPQFEVELTKDILEMTRDDLPWWPDIILASPPCEGFTVMNIGRNWGRGQRGNPDNDPDYHTPKTPVAAMGLKLVERTREIIGACSPRFFVIENPRGKLRKLPVMQDLERRTVTYCQYGEKWMKPTDLWGRFPKSLELHPACKNGAPCHERAPRGSRSGIQGKLTPAERGKIPYLLADAVRLAAEADL
jgi:hypothetical protein